MSAPAPDISGFVAAQANLRQSAGTDVVFRIPVAPTWPEATKINPSTGEPYDALAQRENAAWEEVTKRVLVILKQGSALRPQSDTDIVALGEMSGMDIILDIAASDYEEIRAAKEMTVHGLDYSIREAKPFGLGNGPAYRFLVYAEQK